jgi:CheY-like chemotaxis protein/MinD-like ATPase involved in chromosome partitioning or flagellar assembly
MNKRILVIDDDPIATRLMEYVMKKRGYQVFTTLNGLEGLQIARRETPDLIILNVMLPGIDGLEVCHRIRSDKEIPQPLILMLSGKAQQSDITNGMNVGADDYLTKPAAPSDIVSRIDSLLAQKASARSRTIVFIGSKEQAGTTTIVVNESIALAEMGKQVIAVDLSSADGSISDRLGMKRQSPPTRLSKGFADDRGRSIIEPALVVHESGLGILRIRQPVTGPDDEQTEVTDFPLDKFREVTDYFLVDLPFEPTALARAFLKRSDLAMIVSDCTTEALSGIKSTISILRFLGIPAKRIGAVVTDTLGTFSQKELPSIKSYFEPNISVAIWGIVPFDASLAAAVSGRQLKTTYNNDSPMANAIKELAQRIITTEITGNDFSREIHNAVKRK